MKLYFKCLLSKWWYLLSYLASILAVWFLVALKSLDFELVGDYLRLTWLFFLIGIIVSAFADTRKIKALQVGKFPSEGNLVEQAYGNYLTEKRQALAESEQQLRTIYKERADYLRIWSHEIKTPLTALALLAQTKDKIPASEVSHQVEAASYQLNLLLNYERMADFNNDLEFKHVELLPLIQKVAQKNMNYFIGKNIGLQIEVKKGTVLTDEKWLAFILEQLLINAVKYSQANKKITITYQAGKLSIIDQGIGISASDLPRIYEAGFTGANGRKFGAATGMGLYIVKTMADKLNIGLQVDSSLGQGTTVNLIFN